MSSSECAVCGGKNQDLLRSKRLEDFLIPLIYTAWICI